MDGINPDYAGSQKDHFVYLYDEMTRREGAPLRATMPDWIIQNCLNLLREREAEAAKGGALSANSAVAAALEAASANSGGSNGGRPAAPPPPTKGAQTLHAHQVQLQTVYRKHFDIQIMVGITTHSGNSVIVTNWACIESISDYMSQILFYRVRQPLTVLLLRLLSSPG